MLALENIELLKQLKARYFRALDSKDWTLMRSCLHDECIAAYDGGKYSFDGADNIVQFFQQYMSSPDMIFMHHGHLPEIEIESAEKAKGIWYLQDKVINLQANTTLEGAGFYHDEYQKVEGQWLIYRTGYERTFEEVHQRDKVRLNFNRFKVEVLSRPI